MVLSYEQPTNAVRMRAKGSPNQLAADAGDPLRDPGYAFTFSRERVLAEREWTLCLFTLI